MKFSLLTCLFIKTCNVLLLSVNLINTNSLRCYEQLLIIIYYNLPQYMLKNVPHVKKCGKHAGEKVAGR